MMMMVTMVILLMVPFVPRLLHTCLLEGLDIFSFLHDYGDDGGDDDDDYDDDDDKVE